MTKPASHKRKDAIDLCAYAFIEGAKNRTQEPPKQLKFSDNLFLFNGQRSDKEILWGTWGMASHNTAQMICNNFANKNGFFAITLIMRYMMPGAAKINSVFTPETIEATGLVNLPRLSAATKDFIKDVWLGKIEEEEGSQRRRACQEETLENIAIIFPHYAQGMLKGPQDIGLSHNVEIQAIIHPVRSGLDDDPNDPYPLIQIASVRNDPERIGSLEAQYLNSIEVLA